MATELPPTALSEAHGMAGERRLRRARWMVMGALSVIVFQIPAFAVVVLVNILATGYMPLWRGGIGLLLAALLGVCTLWFVVNRTENGQERLDTIFWSSCALFLGTAVAFDLDLWTALIASVWLSVVVASYPHRSVLWVALAVCALPWIRALFYTDPDWMRILVVWAIALGFGGGLLVGNLGILRLWNLSREVVAGRWAQARLAVSEERLRIARDIHDLLGHSLSGIAVRSQLAARLTEREPERAVREMLSVQHAARETLREVRSAVSGYRDVDPRVELESARGVITAAGARCTVTGPVDDVPDHLRGAVAWIVREAATNIIRHSSARTCEFAFHRGPGGLTLEVHNDGVPRRGRRPDVGAGSGVTGLTERVASVHGTLTVSYSGADGFLLRAFFPAEWESERLVPEGGGTVNTEERK